MNISLTEKRIPSVDGKHKLFCRVFVPQGEPKGIFHVVHGMIEHISRYEDFMRFIAGQGYVCFGYDNLGHGHTAADKSELGFIAHKNGWSMLADDVNNAGRRMIEEYGDTLPYILMGHSMGSFIVRIAAERYPRLADKLIIMGTGGPNPASLFGLGLIDIIRAVRGEKYVSTLVDNMAFGAYNKRFGEGVEGNWLSKDPAVQKSYEDDPLCDFKFSVSAMHDLVKLSYESNKGKWFDNINGELPVFLLSGANDPVGSHSKGVTKVYRKLSDRKKNVKMKLYPTGRHEILNDDTADEVKSDILDFVGKKILK